mmetsp:Transcript_25616/g.32742  ORF Transcript_25616/g.32742 Transcript_25616/m.32742 type:complete len:87 (-) Transcript_25616:47-307(-)
MSIESVKLDSMEPQCPDDTNAPHRDDGKKYPTVCDWRPGRARPVAEGKGKIEGKGDEHAINGQKNGPLFRPRKVVNTVHMHGDNFL